MKESAKAAELDSGGSGERESRVQTSISVGFLGHVWNLLGLWSQTVTTLSLSRSPRVHATRPNSEGTAKFANPPSIHSGTHQVIFHVWMREHSPACPRAALNRLR